MPTLSMKAFEPYVRSLEGLASELTTTGKWTIARKQVELALDGQPAQQLRELVAPQSRRTAGAYFTTKALRERLLKRTLRAIDLSAVIMDPACGAGDLLIECASHLPLSEDLGSTIQTWGMCLRGYDRHEEFVRATKARLILAALLRGVHLDPTPLPPAHEVFPHIQTGNVLEVSHAWRSATHILLNPPYRPMDAPKDCKWAQGQVSAASVFLDACLSGASPGTHILALLPDVLRAGTRYAKWRAHVEAAARVDAIERLGQFDPWTDVDVFLLHLRASVMPDGQNVSWWATPEQEGQGRVDDHFRISVGPVVPHRHPESGPPQRYIYARLLSGRAVFDADTAPCRLFAGRSFLPPFVTVCRTSRPDRSTRITQTIVSGTQHVAVENHLIVLEPRDRSSATCEDLVERLASARTKAWLNERIRCRHLTVGALRELPWWESDHEF
jgi:N-6 DNA Methylase